MDELYNMLHHTSISIQEVADLLYQQQMTEGMQKLNDLLIEITELSGLLIEKTREETKDFDEQKFLTTLTEAMEALKESDYVLLADILQYDLLEQLSEIHEKF